MAFNHYAKIKRILADYTGWYIVRINEPTSSTKFNGEKTVYDHYYRVYDKFDQPIAYCKFQQIERFTKAMKLDYEALPIINND